MVSRTYASQLPYWKDLEDDEKETAANGAVIRRYKKDACIYGLHDACLGMIYVTKGSIREYLLSEEGREVTLFHPETKLVTVLDMESGRSFEESYDQLILSPGARPIQPDLPGMDSDRLFSLRTVEDTFRLMN